MNISNAMDAVQEKIKVTLRIDNAQIADVYNGEFFTGSLCIYKDIIISYEKLDAELVIDAQNAYLIPSFMDAHVHIESSMLSPKAFANMVIPFGTTTIMADPHEIANVKGEDGIQYMMENAENSLLDVRFMLPSCVPALPFEDAGATLNTANLEKFMGHPRVNGLGEMMNLQGVIQQDSDVMSKIELAKKYNKIIDGHAPNAEKNNLDAYILSGVKTDHECTHPNEAKEKLKRGMYIIMREGSAAKDLLNLLPFVNSHNAKYCLLGTDDMNPAHIREHGHINNLVKMLVNNGVEPITAIRMASTNTAECYNIQNKGSLGIGKIADCMLVSNLKDFIPSHVFIKGKLVATLGEMISQTVIETIEEKKLEQRMLNSMNFNMPKNLNIHIPTQKARLIKIMPHSLITECVIQNVETDENNNFDFEKNDGIIKIAVIERHKNTGNVGCALLHPQYGLRNGAIALSIAHDSHNIVVAGTNDNDMLLAVEHVKKMGGGIAMTYNNKILADLPLPIAGLMTNENPQVVARKLQELLELARIHYQIWDKADAFMTLSFLALPVIPNIKITTKGLFLFDTFQFTTTYVE